MQNANRLPNMLSYRHMDTPFHVLYQSPYSYISFIKVVSVLWNEALSLWNNFLQDTFHFYPPVDSCLSIQYEYGAKLQLA